MVFFIVPGYANDTNDQIRVVSSEGNIVFPVRTLINCQYDPHTDSLSINLIDTTLKFRTDQSLFIDFWDEQYSVLDPDSIPDNEIWYTSHTRQKLDLRKTNLFGAEFDTHTYENGRGIIKFKGAVKNIPPRDVSSQSFVWSGFTRINFIATNSRDYSICCFLQHRIARNHHSRRCPYNR